MSLRKKILNNINSNKPALVELPVISMNEVIQYDDVVAQFKSVLESIGGTVHESADILHFKNFPEQEKQSGKNIINTVAELGSINNDIKSLSAHDLAFVDKAYIKGTVAVAENGSVWVYESQMINRLLPFICEHLVLVIGKKDIVATMHHAYQKIDTASEGFGVFIAGPSKTADIEQSLVLGAHGPRNLTVLIYG